MKFLIALILVALCLSSFAAHVHAARHTRAASDLTFTVNSTLDEPDARPGDGKCQSAPSKKCTLRAAIMENNALGGGNTILVPAGTFILTRGDPAEPSEDTGARGDLDVLAKLKLDGAGAGKTMIDGAHNDRVFDLFAPAKIRGVSIENGASQENGGGIKVETGAKLTLTNGIVTNNGAVKGSGIYGGGSVKIKNSKIISNLCLNYAQQGGGVYLAYGGLISKSRISRNCADQGGGIYVTDLADVGIPWYLEQSTVDNNKAREGGGIYMAGPGGAWAVNSTIANNVANLGSGNMGEGGGVYAIVHPTDRFTFYNTTIASNVAGVGGTAGGIYFANVGEVALKNTILDANAPDDCEGTFALLNYNLIYNPNGCNLSADTGTQIGVHAALNTLANNGGPTPTMALKPGSPAMDVVPYYQCKFNGGILHIDQRGEYRPADGDGDGIARCDIGAFEVQP